MVLRQNLNLSDKVYPQTLVKHFRVDIQTQTGQLIGPNNPKMTNNVNYNRIKVQTLQCQQGPSINQSIRMRLEMTRNHPSSPTSSSTPWLQFLLSENSSRLVFFLDKTTLRSQISRLGLKRQEVTH